MTTLTIECFYTHVVLTGAVTVPGGGLGMFLGGYIVKRYNLKIRDMLKMVLGLSGVVTVVLFTYIVRCENVVFAGINVDYTGRLLSG